MDITRDPHLMSNFRQSSYCLPTAFLIVTRSKLLKKTDRVILWQRDPNIRDQLSFAWEALSDHPLSTENLDTALHRLMQDAFGPDYPHVRWEELGVETHKNITDTLICTFIILGRLRRLPQFAIKPYLSKFTHYNVFELQRALALMSLRYEHAVFLRLIAQWCGDKKLQKFISSLGPLVKS